MPVHCTQNHDLAEQHTGKVLIIHYHWLIHSVESIVMIVMLGAGGCGGGGGGGGNSTEELLPKKT